MSANHDTKVTHHVLINETLLKGINKVNFLIKISILFIFAKIKKKYKKTKYLKIEEKKLRTQSSLKSVR